MFDQPSIEKLKHEFTDKYVVVDGGRPELARFVGMTGQIKTVNMSGKALVQFDGRLNIGWYDIGLDFLKIVPKPEPKPEDQKHAKKPAAAKPQTSADSPAVAPNPVGAASSTTAGEKKPSVLEQLKAQGAAKAAATAAPAKETPAPAPEPVAEKKPESKPAETAPAGEKKKLSTADILAALKKKP